VVYHLHFIRLNLLADDLGDHHDLSDCAFAGYSSPKNKVLFVPSFEIEIPIDHSIEARFAHPSASSLHSGSDEGFDCHFRRINLASFGNGRVAQAVVFSICEAIAAFDLWIASNVERFHNALPYKVSLKYFYDGC